MQTYIIYIQNKKLNIINGNIKYNILGKTLNNKINRQ